MKIKIKSKLFFSFIILCFFSLLIAIVSVIVYHQKESFVKQMKVLDEVHILTMDAYKLHQDFLINEASSIQYYKTEKSLVLNDHHSISNKISDKLYLLKENRFAKRLFNENFVSGLLKAHESYVGIFDNVVEQIKVKGFQDFGLEGQMRNEAHRLMNTANLNQIDILMLRRHEKDFIIRKEIKYVNQFRSVVNKVKSDIEWRSGFSADEKSNILLTLSRYANAFYKFVDTEILLQGSTLDEGLLQTLSAKHQQIISQIIRQKAEAELVADKIIRTIFFVALAVVVLIFVLAFVFSYRLAKELSQPLVNLNRYINNYIESKFLKWPNIEVRTSKDEISELTDNFYKMANEISQHIKFFEEKVEERTQEVNLQSEKILQQKVKIFRQYNELSTKNEALELQQKLTLDKNKSILDSIQYAQRIQQSIMPSQASMKQLFPNSFIYFQPRDIVSGDFYFMVEKNRKLYFAIADCTGHGVPGAFVSIIGMHAIHRALNEFNLEQPAEILNRVNNLVVQNISNNSDTIIDDGMDIAFCSIDLDTKQLEFAGAHMPLWIVRKHDEVLNESYSNPMHYMKQLGHTDTTYAIEEVKADNQPIGHFMKRIPFTNHKIKLQSGDSIYIFSDGYADQFGGVEGKKFKYNRLKSLMLGLQDFSMDMQHVQVKETFRIWKGDFDQVDDVCVFGMQV